MIRTLILAVALVGLAASEVSAFDAGMKVATFNHNNGNGNDGNDGRQDGEHGHNGRPRE
jgi:hypothetical protein